MQAKVELNRTRDTGKVIDDSILFIKQNSRQLIRSYFTICGIFWITGLVVTTFQQLNYFNSLGSGASIFNGLYFVALLIQLISQVLIMVFTYSFMALYKEKGNQAPTTVEVWGYVQYYFLRAGGSYILLGIMMLIGFVFCFLPGIYLMVVFAMVFPIMMLENGGLSYSFNRAFKLIKDRWWTTFGVLILSILLMYVAFLLVAIPASAVAGIFIFFTGVNSYRAIMIAYSISSHLAQLLYLLPYIVAGMWYFSLVEQQENTYILHRIEMLGKEDDNDAPADPQHIEEY